MDIGIVREQVAREAKRVKELGNWPAHVSEESLVKRIPEDGSTAPGFDAGIACCLDLIPRDKQRLSAILHGAYTPEAVEQVRLEIKTHIIDVIEQTKPSKLKSKAGLYPGSLGEKLAKKAVFESETIWWLAACNFCSEGSNSSDMIIEQIEDFGGMSEPSQVWQEAYDQYKKLKESFHVIDSIAVATQDGGMAAAYINGHSLAIMPAYGIWFVGTYHSTLGIESVDQASFKWGRSKDEKGRPMSGPVFGSKQFVKCATFEELNDVLFIARRELSPFLGP